MDRKPLSGWPLAMSVLVCLTLAIVLNIFLDEIDARTRAQPVLQEFSQTVSATQTNTAITIPFAAPYIYIKNMGATNEAYVTLASTTSTTSKLELRPGETLTLQGITPTSRAGVICATGETTTVIFGAWSR